MTLIRYWTIAKGNDGVRQTVDLILRMIRSPMPEIRQMAERIVRDAYVTDFNELVWASAIYRWVQRHMTYTPDASHPVTLADGSGDLLDEELRSPDYLLGQIHEQGTAFGDCDDYVILMGALLLAVGIPFQIVVISSSPSGIYDHIYLQLFDGTAMDAITNQPFGWSVPEERVTAREVMNG